MEMHQRGHGLQQGLLRGYNTPDTLREIDAASKPEGVPGQEAARTCRALSIAPPGLDPRPGMIIYLLSHGSPAPPPSSPWPSAGLGHPEPARENGDLLCGEGCTQVTWSEMALYCVSCIVVALCAYAMLRHERSFTGR
jgi:hypothetical protein